MNGKPQSRKEKIQLLKDLQSGKISVTDIIPGITVIWLFKKDVYASYSEKGKLILTEAEFKEYTSERPKQRNIIFRLQEGNEPLKEKL